MNIPGECLGEGGGDAAFFRAHDAIGNAILGGLVSGLPDEAHLAGPP